MSLAIFTISISVLRRTEISLFGSLWQLKETPHSPANGNTRSAENVKRKGLIPNGKQTKSSSCSAFPIERMVWSVHIRNHNATCQSAKSHPRLHIRFIRRIRQEDDLL